LEPSPDTLGGSVIVVRSARKAFDGSVLLDRRTSPYFGDGKVTGNFAWNAIGERADHVWLTVSSSLAVGANADINVGYDAQVADNGTSMSLAGSHSRSQPGRELKLLNVQSQVTSLLGTAAVPLIRSRGENLRAVAQFEMRNVDTNIADVAFTRDRLRILRAGLSYDMSDRWNGITAIRTMLHQGLPGLGASSNDSGLASRADGSSEFTKLTLELTRLQQITKRVILLSSFTSQFSAKRLLASEEFNLGGANFGRGFDNGEITADNGLAASLELRYVPAGLPRNVQIYGFVDGGRVWTADGNDVTPNTRLASFGGGVRASLSSTLFATLELAKPIDSIVRTQGDKDARVFLSIQAQF
jgi:hemolysin activation/secretion protein